MWTLLRGAWMSYSGALCVNQSFCVPAACRLLLVMCGRRCRGSDQTDASVAVARASTAASTCCAVKRQVVALALAVVARQVLEAVMG